MARGTVIHASKVKPLYVDETYTSKMLIDKTNSDSQFVQVNMGIVAPGAQHPDHHHPVGNDEVYLILRGEGRIRLDGVEYDVDPGDSVFIPGGIDHAIINRSATEELVIYTVWPKHPAEGVNPVYDQRLAEWGKSYKTIDEE